MYTKTQSEKEELVSLWKEFKKNKSKSIRQKLIQQYYPYVQHLAQGLAAKLMYRVKKEELASYGLDGLYKAIPLFDINQGVKFETFSYRRILGSMIDNLRKIDRTRYIRARLDKIEKAREILEQEYKSKIIDDELCELNEEVKKEIKKGVYSITSLSIDSISKNDSKEDDKNELKDNYDVNLLQDIECCETFKKLTSSLSMKEKRIIYLLFYKGMSPKEVAKITKSYTKIIKKKKQEILEKIKDFAEINNLKEEILFPNKK